MTIEFLTGIERILILMDLAIEAAIVESRDFVFIDWQSRNHRGLEV